MLRREALSPKISEAIEDRINHSTNPPYHLGLLGWAQKAMRSFWKLIIFSW
jgi:hypothetical protein